MAEKNTPFRTGSTISCCRYCVPPKRHTACWDHCPEYLKERAEYDAKKEKEKVRKGLDAQFIASVNRARKGGK
jgi:hypothetical protein